LAVVVALTTAPLAAVLLVAVTRDVAAAGFFGDDTFTERDETFDTVDTDYLSSRGCCHAWDGRQRVNGDQFMVWRGCAGTGPAGSLVVLLTIIKRPVTCSRLGGPEFRATGSLQLF